MRENGPGSSKKWRIFIDTGGTFTDCLAEDPSGEKKRVKVLSSSALRGRISKQLDDLRFVIDTPWHGSDDLVRGFRFKLLERDHPGVDVLHYKAAQNLVELSRPIGVGVLEGALFELLSNEEAPLLATRLSTHTPPGTAFPPLSMRLGTTRGTNALLTRSGTPPVLFITKGFKDLLEIRTQARPDIFALRVEKPTQLYEAVIEVEGRLGADGKELAPLNLHSLEKSIEKTVQRGHLSAAVALLHSDKNPVHEQQVAERLARAGFEHISISHDLAPFIKILTRAETAVVDAYISPVIDTYLAEIDAASDKGQFFVMTSAGGLSEAASFRAKDSLLSGPAGGIAGAAEAGAQAGFERLLAFDMGGTSTDVARYDGDFEYVFEHEVGDAHLATPALAIESVAAGGGSVCSYDGYRLNVGPESAGASPGPACYGAGGPLTITDVNLLLCRLDPNRFEIPVIRKAADKALDEIIDALAEVTGERPTKEALLDGFLEIANQRIIDAVRHISLKVGYDPADYVLVAFGGAGPQHAVSVAKGLGARAVLIPEHPGLLSAEGLCGAVVERFAEKQLLAPLLEVEDVLSKHLDKLGDEAKVKLKAQGVRAEEMIIRRRMASLRFRGQDATLEVDIDDKRKLGELFEERYNHVFGHLPHGRTIELCSLRVVASTTRPPNVQPGRSSTIYEPTPKTNTKVCCQGRWLNTPIFERETLRAGARFFGPCLVFERYSTTVIEPDWQVDVTPSLALLIRPKENIRLARKQNSRPESVRLELFTHRFETIAREMGELLRRTAISTNIKERLDYSTAILDADGELVVNAPHMPVHLGSLGLCVREVAATLELKPGDTAITNHPAYGGSHLPDVTLISPVHGPENRLIGYVTSRAHHAEIGGILPGSMPPTATRLVEEGVVIAPTYLVKDGGSHFDSLVQLLEDAPFPTRALEDNLADIRAALAANLKGAAALKALAETEGEKALNHHMRLLKDRATKKIKAALSRTPDGRYGAKDILDDGTTLNVEITIKGDSAFFDFSKTSGVHKGNLNATPAIVRSAVLYVLRLLVDEPLPLNEGLMGGIDMHIPVGILNPPFPSDPADSPAVVGGNVETSQRLVNALLRALGLLASSQGTMNNLLFGNDNMSYYETICGGMGAGSGFHGASAVHSHMTNTRITDPEIVEHRYPVRVERFAIRKGSGGKGRFCGGDGAIRELCFLAPLTLSILSQHRNSGPLGIKGGGSGKPGSQLLIRASGEEQYLKAIDTQTVGPGDRLIIKTPGGGGYGS
ncbi:MAG: 5-oxoprolinase [Proteobacteria bacterium]|nr:5-oxoprolinase [Pseudomonadota bacterium]